MSGNLQVKSTTPCRSNQRARTATSTAIACDSALVAGSIARRLSELRAELGGPHPTRTERLLVDQVAACWLALRHAELSAADEGGAIAQASFRIRRVEGAQRRYLAAVKML